MNLLTEDINEITRTVLKQLLALKVTYRVHVSIAGRVAVKRADALRGLPVETLVGTYTHQVTHADLRDDLLARRAELDWAVAA